MKYNVDQLNLHETLLYKHKEKYINIHLVIIIIIIIIIIIYYYNYYFLHQPLKFSVLLLLECASNRMGNNCSLFGNAENSLRNVFSSNVFDFP